MFQSLDKNGDGLFTKEEAKFLFKSWDRNGKCLTRDLIAHHMILDRIIKQYSPRFMLDCKQIVDVIILRAITFSWLGRRSKNTFLVAD